MKTTSLPAARSCVPSATALCLNGSRFKAEVVWRVPSQDKGGIGEAVSVTTDTGYFWFFSSDNVELVIKVIGSADTGFWVFYGALSDVEYTITVTDPATGAVRTYFNPSGRLASVADTHAFPRDPPLAETSAQAPSPSLGAAAQDTAAPLASSPEWHSAHSAQEEVCTAGPTTLCLHDGRFQVQAAWRVPAQGSTGPGMAVPLTGDTGAYWFFSSNNIEVVIKVLDGRTFNDAFWVFYGSLSDVQYTITVSDMKTGAVRTYWNGAGQLASVADTTAFGPAASPPVWRRLAPAPLGVPAIALAVDPLRGESVYAGNAWGLFRLRIGGGDDWVPTSVSSTVVYTIAIAPTDPPTIYLTALGAESPIRGLRYRTLFRSNDGGETFTGSLNSITSVAVDPSRPATAYAGASPDFVWYATGVHKTDDSGVHWAPSTGGFSCTAIAASVADPSILFAAGGAIFKSTDAGVTWSAVLTGDFVYGAMVVDPASPSTVYVGSATGKFPSSPGLLKTTDGGATWSFVPTPGPIGPMVFDPLSRALLAGSDRGVLRSDDEGQTWKPFNDGLTGFLVSSLALGPGHTLYASTGDGIFAISILSRASSRPPPTRTVPFRLLHEAQD